MDDEQPLTHPLFATEQESNIVNSVNNWVFPTPMDLPPPHLVAQEETRPHHETDQIVCSTPHRPRWRMEDGEMVCVILISSPVLQRDTQPLPSQATMYQACCPGLLVCPPLPRNGGVGRELHQAEMVCGRVLASPLSYEERSEVVCLGWGRTARSLPHQTSNTTEPSSEMWNNLGATGTHGHTTHHYVPLLIPLETANVCVLIAPNVNFSYPCVDGEVECAHNGGVLPEEGGSECNTITENPTPPTQQFVSGWIVSWIESHDVT